MDTNDNPIPPASEPAAPPAAAAPSAAPPPVQPPPIQAPPGLPHWVQPPPLLPGMAPRPRRAGSRAWLWVILALVVAGVCAVAAIWHLNPLPSLARRASDKYHSHGPKMEEVVLECDDSDDKIAVLSIDGVIMSESIDRSGFSMVDVIEEQLKRAGADDNVKAVILKVDSPGGEVLASDDINQLLAKFQDENEKPVIVSMGSMAASGGYYVSAPCRWIVANKLTLTGSIGVIMSTLNYRGLMDKIGLRPEVFKSGQFKDMLRGSKTEAEISPEERKMIQNVVDEAYAEFAKVVGEGRSKAAAKNKAGDGAGRPLIPNWKQLADGRIMTGREAFEAGFVDELGDFKTAVKRALKLADIKSAALVRYREVFDFASMFRLFSKSSAPALKVDLGLDVPKIKSGQLYYLAPAFTR